MTLDHFDQLKQEDRVRWTAFNRTIDGTVSARGEDEIEIIWDDGRAMKIVRHQLRIYSQYYTYITPVPTP